ncbi:MAG: HAD hydrolase family protein [Muribaculaceae bacterium]|nr:HAD hydrolase family protein [Muribaculaceae bacterium]MBR1727348.1 HAD hydrolase family protein [Muribaculaceae bacterium]
MKFHANTTLFVSDMDGTLMDGQSRVSDRTARILNDLIDRHHLLFTVATARTTATVVPLLGQVHCTLPQIVLSGAILWHPVEQRLSDPQAIDPATVQRVCGICERHGIHPFIYRQHGNVIHAHHYGPLAHYDRQFIDARDGTPHKRFLLDDPHYATSDDDTLLLFAMDKAGSLQAVYDEIRQQVDCAPMYYHDNTDPQLALLEIYAPGCSKAAAVARLARQLAVEQVVAFGDNLNDIAMLQTADHSVAVANAMPQVRAIASEVIGPNTDDSVAHWLQQALADL